MKENILAKQKTSDLSPSRSQEHQNCESQSSSVSEDEFDLSSGFLTSMTSFKATTDRNKAHSTHIFVEIKFMPDSEQ